MVRKRRGALSIVLVFLFVLSGCAPTAAPSVITPTLAPIKIKAGAPPILSNSPFFIAQDEGFFAEQGLDVEFVTIGSTTKSVPLLVSGDVDMLAGGVAVAGLNAIVKGTNIKVVADKGHYEPGKCASIAYVVRPGFIEQHKLGNISDLKGVKVSVNMTAYGGFSFETVLKNGGLTVDDVEISNLDTAAELLAVEQGTIDLVAFLEPQLTQEVQAGRVVVWMTGDKIAPGKQLAYVMYGSTILDKNPEAGKRFMVAYLKAVRQYNQGPTDRNLDIIAKYTKVDRAILKQACWQYIAEDGQIDTDSIVRFEDWAVQKKLMDSAATVDQFWDPSFSEYANQVLSSGK